MLRPPGFRVLLTLLFGLLSLAMTCIVAVGLSTYVKGRLAAEQQDALQTLARSTGAMLAEGLYERMREVELLAAGPELRRAKLDAGTWRPVLARMQQTRPQFAWIGVTDADGRVRVATGGLLEGLHVNSRPWFHGAVQGPYVGDVHTAQLLAQKLPPAADGGPPRFVDFAAPLHDPQGRFIGVLGVHGAWDWAGEVVRTLRGERNRDRGILVHIVDDTGRVLHRPAGVTTPDVLPPEVRLPARRAIVTWPDERDYLTAVARVPARGPAAALGWTVIVRQPVDIAFETADQAARIAIGIGLAIGALGLAGLWWLAGRMSAPVARITEAARAIEAGRFDVVIPDEARTRETHELAQSLRAMTAALLAQKAEVETANRRLEERVADRTAALEQASAALERLARHDSLTGLLNRRVADERLLAELALQRRHGTPFGLLLIDIDHFKQVNDHHGHDVGDAVLVEVARRMAAVCRSTDLLARWGGEEFVVLVASTEAEGARVAAEKLRAAVSEGPIGPLERVTVSVGVAVPAAPASGPAGTPVALLKAADRALYEAKRQGRDRVVLDDPASGYQCIDARSLA